MKTKKYIVLVLVFCICILAFPTTAFCSTRTTQTIYYEDGSYSILELETFESPYSLYETTTKTGHATNTLYSKSGDRLFAVAVIGLFTYTGVASYCRESNVRTEVYSSDWKIMSSSATKYANVAEATATGRVYFLGVPSGDTTISAHVECDKDGNLSVY